jgi:preprotein translocase subunit SecD
VVLLFTHPALQLLAKTAFFSEGHRLSGLDPQALGVVYRGAAQFRAPALSANRGKAARSSNEAARRQTIAERKAAELAVSSSSSDRSAEGKDS